LCIYIIRGNQQNNDIDVISQFWTKFTQTFPEAHHHRTQNSKIIAIEPMNRKAGSSISRDKSASEVSKPRETITIQVMSISQCARVANFPDCLCPKVFYVTINQLRDGAAVSDRLVENVIPFHGLGPNY
jgi:hypothetical protein